MFELIAKLIAEGSPEIAIVLLGEIKVKAGTQEEDTANKLAALALAELRIA